jgi:hypothetical protein
LLRYKLAFSSGSKGIVTNPCYRLLKLLPFLLQEDEEQSVEDDQDGHEEEEDYSVCSDICFPHLHLAFDGAFVRQGQGFLRLSPTADQSLSVLPVQTSFSDYYTSAPM